MVDDAFKITLDELFPAIKRFQNENSVFHVDKYNNDENMWELLGNLNEGQILEPTTLRSKHIYFTNSTMCFKIKEFGSKPKEVKSHIDEPVL